MLLYHYTGHVFLPSILEEGLTRGTVLISLRDRMNAVWLTSDPTAADHGLALDPGICDELSRESGGKVRMTNKLAVRILVKIPPNDQRLVYWPKWAKKRVHPDFYDALAKTGGNMDWSWWLYRGVIPPAWFIAIDELEPPTKDDLKLQEALAMVLQGASMSPEFGNRRRVGRSLSVVKSRSRTSPSVSSS